MSWVRVPLATPDFVRYAKVAELVDALASGVSVLTDVRVQVPLFAPGKTVKKIGE